MSKGRAPVRTTPLRAWREADLVRIGRVLQAACDAWARDWEVVADARTECQAAAGELAPADGWRALGSCGEARAWVHCGLQEDAHLAAGWFEVADTTTPVVRDLVAACRTDLMQCLARALRLEPAGTNEAAPPNGFARWSGAVMATLPCRGLLLMEAGVADPLVQAGGSRPARAGLVGIGEAMAAAPLHLRVDLQGCELPLGALQSLRPGDVLRLPHRVDVPATVMDERGNAVFRGWLARTRGRRAVELASLDPR